MLCYKFYIIDPAVNSYCGSDRNEQSEAWEDNQQGENENVAVYCI